MLYYISVCLISLFHTLPSYHCPFHRVYSHFHADLLPQILLALPLKITHKMRCDRATACYGCIPQPKHTRHTQHTANEHSTLEASGSTRTYHDQRFGAKECQPASSQYGWLALAAHRLGSLRCIRSDACCFQIRGSLPSAMCLNE